MREAIIKRAAKELKEGHVCEFRDRLAHACG